MKSTVYIALGSNVGHRLHYLREAVLKLREIIEDLRTSIVIETEALLPENAPTSWNLPYLNMVVAGETTLSPQELMRKLQVIEQHLGREKEHPFWGPRTMDLDILLYGNDVINTPELTIPHKGLKERNFLLHLMASLAPALPYPTTTQTFEALAQVNKFQPKKSFALFPRLMGIVNVTPDSFSDGGRYIDPQNAIEHCKKLLSDGAEILDIGAQSTRPGARQISPEEEWERLQPVLDQLDLKNIPVSIDTFRDEVIRKLVKTYPIAWINDVSGKLQNDTLEAVQQAGCKICVMHALSIPPVKTENIAPSWDTLDIWAEQQIKKLTAVGFKKSDIVLDPGFGFGKTPYATGLLLKTVDHMRAWGCPILIGHSRKSFYNLLNATEAHQRDIETLAISQYLSGKVDYLRVHNVEWHQRFLSAQQWITSCK